MKIQRKADFWTGAFFIVLCVAYMLLAGQLPPSKFLDIGPGFMPLIYGGIGIALSIALIANSFRAAPEDGAAEGDDAPKSEYGRVLVSFLLLGMYVLLLEPVGFIIMTMVYLFCQMVVLAPKDKRNYLVLAIISVVCAFVIFYVFRKAFQIQLPVGVLKFLH